MEDDHEDEDAAAIMGDHARSNQFFCNHFSLVLITVTTQFATRQ